MLKLIVALLITTKLQAQPVAKVICDSESLFIAYDIAKRSMFFLNKEDGTSLRYEGGQIRIQDTLVGRLVIVNEDARSATALFLPKSLEASYNGEAVSGSLLDSSCNDGPRRPYDPRCLSGRLVMKCQSRVP
jgi:hypothetical protein